LLKVFEDGQGRYSPVAGELKVFKLASYVYINIVFRRRNTSWRSFWPEEALQPNPRRKDHLHRHRTSNPLRSRVSCSLILS